MTAPAAQADVVLTTTNVRPDKFGIVGVINRDGSFNREYRVTEAELAELKQSPNGVPPGCTRDEWESSIDRTPLGHPFKILDPCVFVYGKGFETGDMAVDPDSGELTIKYAETTDKATGRIVERFLLVPKEEYTGVPPRITLSQAALPPDIASVSDGVLVTKESASDAEVKG